MKVTIPGRFTPPPLLLVFVLFCSLVTIADAWGANKRRKNRKGDALKVLLKVGDNGGGAESIVIEWSYLCLSNLYQRSVAIILNPFVCGILTWVWRFACL